MFQRNLLAVSLFLAAMPFAGAQTPDIATERMNAYLDGFVDEVGPGFAVTIVTADDILLNRVEGLRRAGTGSPLTVDTPMYIASQTKAYMGLLAAELDQRGILSLDAPLSGFLQDVEWPEGVDPSRYTLRDLLTHQVPIRNGRITFLEAYAAALRPEDYVDLLSNLSVVRAEGFRYDNIGYNIYGAILESSTGRSWQDWLDEIVFDPLGLENTSARTSDFLLTELSWNHIWLGEEQGWHLVRPKTDAMMQSAGGIVTSPNDMARWLQIQLQGPPAASGLSNRAISQTHTAYVQTNEEDGENPYDMSCSGYGLGWNMCTYQGFEVFIHGGSYTGARTTMAFIPEMGVGIAAFSNSDNMTGWWTRTVVHMFLDFLAGIENADELASQRVDSYEGRTEGLLEYRREQIAAGNAEARWAGWAWSPSEDELAAYAGDYRASGVPAGVSVTVAGDRLELHLGDHRVELFPARPDLFGGRTHPLDTAREFAFQRDENGDISGFTWANTVYSRRS